MQPLPFDDLVKAVSEAIIHNRLSTFHWSDYLAILSFILSALSVVIVVISNRPKTDK